MSTFIDCENSVRMTRRGFLKAGAILSFAALPALSFGATVTNTRLLVVLLRGGMDGLFAMPPIGDKQLNALRRNINPDEHLKLDGFFALHPALGNISDMYANGQALLVHGTSIPYVGRSHFEGQDVMESGVMTPYRSRSGWLGRALEVSKYEAALTMTLPVPLVLRGRISADNSYPTWFKSMPKAIYDDLLPLWSPDPDLAPVGEQMAPLTAALAGDMPINPGETTSLVDLARDAARRLKTPNGPRVAVLDHVGFDTHASQPGLHSDRLREVDQALGEFRRTMGDVWKDTLVVTVTEFGRTAAENGSYGTDHGYGTSVFVLGGKLLKSGIVADWPGLKKKNLFEERDLLATLDTRSLYGKIVSSALGIDPELVGRQVLEHTPTDLFDAYF